MTFDPAPFDLVGFDGLQKFLPQIGIFDRLSGGSSPSIFLPTKYPLGYAVFYIFAVDRQRYLARTVQRIERFNRSAQLHAVVRRFRLATGNFLFLVAMTDQCAPAARPGVALARTIGSDLDNFRFSHIINISGWV